MSKINRREFVKRTALGGAGTVLALNFSTRQVAAAANSSFLRKWVQPLRLLGEDGIPVMAGRTDPKFDSTTYYEITAGEFKDKLHPDLPETTLWGYFDSNLKVKRHLGGVIVTARGQAARVRFTNELPPDHILPVDSSLPGAGDKDARNRMAVHLHGGLVPWICDGGPFNWWTPEGVGGMSFLNGPGSVLDNMEGQPMLPGQADFYYPNDQTTRLAWYHDHALGTTRLNAYAGLASGYLILDMRNDELEEHGLIPPLSSTHPLIFQDKIFVGPSTALTDPTWFQIVPAKAQTEGSLWYDHIYNPRDFKQKKGAAYRTPPNPSCIPEFFGDTMLCNGTVYPLLEVDPKRYRFFVLNACNARFLNINVLQANPKNVDGIDLHLKTLFPLNPPGPDIIQLGTEGGFLTREVRHVSPKPFSPITLKGNLLLGPAERADIIIDFTGQEGKEFILYNDAPGPFPAGPPTTDYYLGNPKNPIQPTTIRDKSTGQKWSTGPDTRQILRIRVSNAAVSDPQPPGPILDADDIEPALLSPIPRNTAGPIPPLAPPNSATLRQLTLNEDFDEYGRLRQALGTFAPNKTGTGFGLEYLDPATETPAAGAVEVWDIFNLTADTHPIHFHLVNVQVLSRQPFTTHGGLITPAAAARGPEPEEWGWKETVQMHPSEVTRVTMKFALPDVPFAVPGSPRATEGTVPDASRKYHEYVWHCHILEHEEHDMMRPIFVEEPPKP